MRPAEVSAYNLDTDITKKGYILPGCRLEKNPLTISLRSVHCYEIGTGSAPLPLKLGCQTFHSGIRGIDYSPKRHMVRTCDNEISGVISTLRHLNVDFICRKRKKRSGVLELSPC